LTYGETKALLLFGITAQGKPLKDHFEIIGHNEALEWVLDIIKDERPINENFIRELHKLILKEPYQVDAMTADGQATKKWIKIGEYKTLPNHVKTKTGAMFFFASPEETPAKMQELLEWYRAEAEKADVNPIILAATFHYKFICIHPFDDGNGRTVRILMNFILMQFGYPPVIIRTEEKRDYLSVLEQADAGMIEPFIDFIAKNMVHSLEIMLKAANGESIEDPDDLDKQIALLEATLKGTGEKIEVLKSKETLESFFETVFPKIIEVFRAVNDKFRKFYVNTTYYIEFPHWIQIDYDEYEINFSEKEIDDLWFLDAAVFDYKAAIAVLLSENQIEKHYIELGVNFDTFNRMNSALFSNQLKLKIIFEKTKYRIIGPNAGTEISKLYHLNFPDTELNNFLQAEAKAHLAFIQEKLKE
jgi:Fic family protein